MRGLVKATLLLAPALASTLAVPAPSRQWDDEQTTDGSFASFSVDPKHSRSPDDWSAHALNFRLDVRPSVDACGYGNVTLDGKVLPQTEEDGVWSGKGSVAMEGKSIVVASWTFNCIEVDDVPDRQLLKFKVDFLDGKPLAEVGFTALFRQNERAEIIKINEGLEHPRHGGSPNKHQPHASHGSFQDGEEKGHHGRPQSFEDDMMELHWMRSQLLELEWMIFEKEQTMFEKSFDHQDEDIRKCDSLKCVLRTAMDKAKGAVHHAVGRLTGDDEFMEGDFHAHRGFPHPPPSKHGKKLFGKHGNHTHSPSGGNSSHPHLPHRFLPVCRFPPPPPHGFGPPHHPGKGPHHGPPGPPRPHWGEPGPHHGPPEYDSHSDWEDNEHHRGPPGPPRPHWEDHESHRGPPGPPPHSHHDRPGFDGHPPGPPHHGNPEDQPARHSPPQLSPDERRPTEHDQPPHGERPHQNQHEGPPQDGEEDVHSDPENEQKHPELFEEGRKHHDGPPPPGHGPDDEFDGPPPHDGPDHGPPHGGPHGGPGGPPPPPPPPRHHRSRLMTTLHIFKWTVVGFLASILLAALHKRTCTPSKRAERQARREKRELRRAYRRHVHKTAINRLMARITGNDSDSDEGEEKYCDENQRLMHDAEDGMSTTMSEEITQLQNAASVVSDMVATPQRPPSIIISQHDATPPPAHMFSDNLYSEELPAYEDNDGSEASSIVADGFRYTPGSSDYSPAHSSSGSVSDILGADTKQ